MSRHPPTAPGDRPPCDLPPPESTRSFWHTEPSPLLTGHRSTRDLPSTADVVIVGSGITGASVAHHLLTRENGESALSHGEKGLNVVMLEAREACWGATGRNGGHCQPLLSEHPHDPSIAYFELANFHALESLISAREMPCEFVAQKGVRGIYSQSHVDETRSALATLKTTAPAIAAMMTLVTDATQLRALRLPTAQAALVTSVAARMWPYKFVASILETLLTSQSLRGTLNLQTWTPATSITPTSEENGNTTSDHGWTITTADRGAIKAKHVVLATNAYTSHLLPSYSDLIVPCRGQMSALTPLSSLAGAHRLTTSYGFMGEGLDDYLIQRPSETGGQLMFGGGRQHGPSIGTVDDSVLDKDTARYLRTRLVEAFGLPEGQGGATGDAGGEKVQLAAENEWTGIMGFSRDDLPWVGPVPAHPNLYIAAGYTGHGMPNTWLCGRAVANMVAGSLSRPGESDSADVVELVCAESGLPRAYIVTEDRIKSVRAEYQDVGVRDWAEMRASDAKKE